MPPPIPILFTIPNFITAGSGRVMMNIVERLDRKRFAPAVCVTQKGGGIGAEVERLGIPYIEAPFLVSPRPYGSLLSRCRRAARVFRPYRFAIWHSWHWQSDYTEPIIARMSGTRRWIYTKKAMGWNRSWLLRSYQATRIAVDNTDMPRRLFDRPGLRHKVRLIHHGIPCDEYSPAQACRLGLREKLGLPQDAVVVGCVANLVARKGHTTLLEAISQVPGVYLLTAGKPIEPDYAAELERMRHRLGIADRVHLLGSVEDIPAFLVETDIYVLPTWAKWSMEGCPVALIEAMAAGRPCVATDIPGSRDLVVHQETGLIVPPEDDSALAGALRALAASPDLRRQFGDGSRRRATECFSIEREVAAYEKLYSEIAVGD